MKALIIAEHCNPEWSSVPLVGWSLSQALSMKIQTHLVTHVRNRDALIRAGLEEGREFTALDSEILARPLWRFSALMRGGENKGWTTIQALSVFSYYYFEHLVWKRFKKEVISKKFDVVHRITPLSPTTPSLLAKRCFEHQVPFVLGPLNGGVPWPKEFAKRRRGEREWLSHVRGVYKLMPGCGSTRKHASAIIVGSKDTLKQMDARYHEKCVYIPENAVDPKRFKAVRRGPFKKPYKIIFVGRLVPYKGADMLLKGAAPLARKGECLIDIVGHGPELKRLNEIIASEKIQNKVRLLGWVKHEHIHDLMVNADFLGFPSVREFGGVVALEAMMMGVIPIVVKYGGPGELVTEKTGYFVQMASEANLIKQLRNLFKALLRTPIDELELKRDQARKRVVDLFTWPEKARQIMGVYEWIMNPKQKKPRYHY